MNAKPEAAKPGLLYCSFCRKSQHEVKKLVAGPAVMICDACIALCNEIIAKSPDPDPSVPAKIKGPQDMPTEQLLKIFRARTPCTGRSVTERRRLLTCCGCAK